MKEKDVQEIIDCLQGHREKFYYFKDRYALLLLSYLVGSGLSIKDLKKSRFRKLLDKPLIQKIVKQNSGSTLTREIINGYWPEQFHCYVLTLDKWGSDEPWRRLENQTSRTGWNLVLQLNFSTQHDAEYTRLIQPDSDHPFECEGHPIIRKKNRHTLAWARIDIDLNKDEALIEEIQTDWIRFALRSKKATMAIETGRARKPRYLPRYLRGLGCDAKALFQYVDGELKPHIQTWEEAMLASAIFFIKEEIGIKNIFYHTFKSGYTLKRIDGTKPPRSLYSKLPSKFCFQMTNESPEFLMEKQNKKVLQSLRKGGFQFFKLDIC